ncbi:MAG: SDR family oxidoreductase [Flavobacteriales bacterium]|nr:SDR family oxidoreductase [Flavobacteriales bacterium]
MNILVTGGLGYIGYTLIEQITKKLNKADSIVIYDNMSRQEFSLLNAHHLDGKNIRFVKGDLLDNRLLKSEVDKADIIVHLAAMVTTPFEDKFFHHFDQVNHWGTANLVSIVEESEVKHFIYPSSISVYGHGEDVIDVDSKLQPDSSYGTSKFQAEKHVRRLAKKIPTHIIRSGNVYGYNPALRLDSVINSFMYQAHFDGKVRINGDGSQCRGFISVADFSALIAALIKNPTYESGIHLAVTKSLQINDILETLMKIYPELEFIYTNENMRMKSVQVKTPSKILGDLNIELKDLEEELLEFKKSFVQ